jgi:lysophospholipase L1-like esterase
MAFALDYLRSHKHTQLVTLTLGANDLFRFQKDCAAGPTVGTCPLGIGGVLATMKANLDTIFAGIRGTGYQGTIIAVTYYSLSYPNTSGSQLLAGPMIAAATAPSVHALVADGIEAWRSTAMSLGGGDSCAAGLLIRLSPTSCDVHPTPLGRDLLAGAVVDTVAASCSAHNARLCLARAAGEGAA